MVRCLKRKIGRPKQAQNSSDEFAFEVAQSGPLVNREHVYAVNEQADRNYRSRPCVYPGRITLINGTISDLWDPNDPKGGFATLAAEIELHKIPGGHGSVLVEPHVKGLAEKLKACLERAQKHPADSTLSHSAKGGQSQQIAFGLQPVCEVFTCQFPV